MTIETRTPVEVPVREKSVADVLRHAARIIEERGWVQGSFGNSAGVCALGAIYAEGSGDPIPEIVPQRQWGAVEALIGTLGLVLVPDVSTWNDTPGRTADEVTAALRSAADAWEAEHVRGE